MAGELPDAFRGTTAVGPFDCGIPEFGPRDVALAPSPALHAADGAHPDPQMFESRQSDGRVGSRRDAGRVGAPPTWLAVVCVVGGAAVSACSATIGSTDEPRGPDGGQTASGGGAGRVTTTGAGGHGAPGGTGGL